MRAVCVRRRDRLLRIIGAWLLLAALPLLSACSMVRVAYNQADDALYWWLNGYVDFNDAQSPRVREDLKRLLSWHRRQELPGYAALLERVQAQAAADTQPAAVCAVFAEARERLMRVTDRVAPTVVAVAPMLDARQITHLEQRFERRNAEWRREWLDDRPQRIRERRIDRAVERAERIYGRLEAAQRRVIEQSIDASAFDAALSLAETRRRQRDTLDTLRALTAGAMPAGAVAGAARTAATPEATPEATLRALLERSLNSPDARYRAHVQRMTADSCSLLAALHNSTTPAQREHAARVLGGWAQDLRALAGTT